MKKAQKSSRNLEYSNSYNDIMKKEYTKKMSQDLIKVH